MFTRFSDIVINLEALGKTYSNGENVRKILRSLPKEWDFKVTTIQDAKKLDILSFDEMIESLMTHYIMMKKEENEDLRKKYKSFAFKLHNLQVRRMAI